MEIDSFFLSVLDWTRVAVCWCRCFDLHPMVTEPFDTLVALTESVSKLYLLLSPMIIPIIIHIQPSNCFPSKRLLVEPWIRLPHTVCLASSLTLTVDLLSFS